jgi:hypothetical protein
VLRSALNAWLWVEQVSQRESLRGVHFLFFLENVVMISTVAVISTRSIDVCLFFDGDWIFLSYLLGRWLDCYG